MPIQFVFDLSSKAMVFEIDRFCQFFNSIEKVRRKPETIDPIEAINHNIMQNHSLQPDFKYKTDAHKKLQLGEEMYNGKNVWLIKPNDFNRGRGVCLFNSLE